MGGEKTFRRRTSTLLALTAILAGSFAPLSLAQEAKSKTKESATKAKDAQSAPAADYGLAQVREINNQISTVWKEKGLSASPPASGSEWCRRVFLDVLGRVPTVPELRDFSADKSADKKAKLVEKLLNDEEYNAEYARNWTPIW